jgi:hypothetical protein
VYSHILQPCLLLSNLPNGTFVHTGLSYTPYKAYSFSQKLTFKHRVPEFVKCEGGSNGEKSNKINSRDDDDKAIILAVEILVCYIKEVHIHAMVLIFSIPLS